MLNDLYVCCIILHKCYNATKLQLHATFVLGITLCKSVVLRHRNHERCYECCIKHYTQHSVKRRHGPQNFLPHNNSYHVKL